MTTLEELNGRIEELTAELERTEGLETEVYSRIVGYYRSIKNWNKGKREEFRHRQAFTEVSRDAEGAEVQIRLPSRPERNRTADSDCTYLYFHRAGCPNCPPVAAYLDGIEAAGKRIDVDTEEGRRLAASHTVLSTPTVVLIDRAGAEVFRAMNRQSLDAYLGAGAHQTAHAS